MTTPRCQKVLQSIGAADTTLAKFALGSLRAARSHLAREVWTASVCTISWWGLRGGEVIGGAGGFLRHGVPGRGVKQAPATEELFAPRMVGRGQDGGAELGANGRLAPPGNAEQGGAGGNTR